ncbi:MAG: flavodoxin domain-containing protein, partial [Cyanobacteria bacterium P01_H01_bin.15]
MEVDKPDFAGKTIALFGPGDCEGHSKHFVGALGTLYDQFKALGAKIVGSVSTEGYSFAKSTSIRDGRFVGLPLDEVNESEKTDQRIADWLESLKADFPLLASSNNA